MRHRAARPSFTVEIKRRRQKSVQALTTGQIAKRESCTSQGQLALDQGTSAQTAPPPNFGGPFNVNLAMASRSSSQTVAPREVRDSTPLAELPTRRILPSILSAQAAALPLDEEVAGIATQRNRTKSKSIKESRLSPPARPAATLFDEQTGGSTTVIEDETLLGTTPDANGLVPGDKHRDAPVIATLMLLNLSDAEGVAENCVPARARRASCGTPRGAHRRAGLMPLRRGERWKRRLPRVCW